PMEWLPDIVLKIAHVLPSYYYIKTNELLTNIETVNFEGMQEIIGNMTIVLIFTIAFMLLSSIVARQKRRKG
ncbi:MAG: hypothetical protein HFJ27_02365, partial [Clostridia bacterium]|nr:hypothetical protein [Clostridia bacterium]